MAGVTVAVIRTPATALRPTRPARPPSTPLAVRFLSGIGLIVGEIPGRTLDGRARSRRFVPGFRLPIFSESSMTTWEYLTTPLLIHNTAAILNNWGKQGWELVQVVPGPEGGLVAYLKRPVGGGRPTPGWMPRPQAAQQFEERRAMSVSAAARRTRHRAAGRRPAGRRLRAGEGARRPGVHRRPAARWSSARFPATGKVGDGRRPGRRRRRQGLRPPVRAQRARRRRGGRRRRRSADRRRQGRRLRGIRPRLHRSARRHQRRERGARRDLRRGRPARALRRGRAACCRSTAPSRSRSSSPSPEPRIGRPSGLRA